MLVDILLLQHYSGWPLCSGQDDVVDGDEDKFDEVADGTHDEEADDAGAQDLHVLGVVWLLALLVEGGTVGHKLRYLLVNVRLLFLLSSGHLARLEFFVLLLAGF